MPGTGNGNLLIVGISGPSLLAAEARILRRVEPGGVILFGRNLRELEQTKELVATLRRTVPEALLFVDAEGGRVDRLRDLVGRSPAAAALAVRPVAHSRRAGRSMGAALRLFDFDVDLAPVVDLDHGARDNALDDRLFGRSSRSVTARARAFLDGLESAGVSGCIKHFPGLGAAAHDTHYAMARIDLDADRLRRDLEPFSRLANDAGAVLLSHALYPAYDDAGLPATLSPAIATRLLRKVVGFRGLAISDDLEMKALDTWGDLRESSCAALIAGCDLLAVCSRIDEVPGIVAAIDRAASRDPRVAARCLQARQRVTRHARRVRLTARRARRTGAAPSLERVRAEIGRLSAAQDQVRRS